MTDNTDSNESEQPPSNSEETPVEVSTAEEGNLLGGLDFSTTADIEVPDTLLNQVIGQEEAIDVVKKAAKQRRHVMMIGEPGTGKSMLAKAMTELLPREQLEDILIYPNPKDENEPKVRTVPAGKGQEIIDEHKEEANKRGQMKNAIMFIIMLGILGYSFLIHQFLIGIIAAAVVFLAFKYGTKDFEEEGPELLVDNSTQNKAPFNDATGAHSGALLGDVRHDPFQSGGMGTPAHQRVESGAIHESNKGVLFLDEINTLQVEDQQNLMTGIQEGEFSITGQSERGSGAMVQTEAVPCDFILVAAGNLDAMENMHPALRSRIKGYGYEVHMDSTIEDTAENRKKFARFVAQEVDKDENIPHFTRDAVKEIVKEARRRANRKDHLTLKLRDLGGLVRTAGDIAYETESEYTKREHVLQAKDKNRSIEQQLADEHINQKKEYGTAQNEGKMIGRVNGLAVMGDDSGIVKPISAEVTQKHGEGEVFATGKLQEIAQESVQNVSAIIKKFTGKDISNLDIHIQFLQSHEGVEGDSASVTIATAIISALEGLEIRQDIAMTGSLSVRGKVLPVGGVTYKIEAAAKTGINKVIVPKSNVDDIVLEKETREKIEIIPAETIEDVLEHAVAESEGKHALMERVQNLASKTAEQLSSELPGGNGSPSTT